MLNDDLTMPFLDKIYIFWKSPAAILIAQRPAPPWLDLGERGPFSAGGGAGRTSPKNSPQLADIVCGNSRLPNNRGL
jgi:hypothetical protein